MQEILFPRNSYRRKVAGKIKSKMMGGGQTDNTLYQYWIDNLEQKTINPTLELNQQPMISVVVPCFNTPDKYLMPMVYSLINQTHSNWELILADASDVDERANKIERVSRKDKRIKYIKIAENQGISTNTNQGIEAATGEYIGLLDHDDTLAPFALNEVGYEIMNSEAKVIYSDEDKLSNDGNLRHKPHFKLDLSPDLLRQVNYVTHFMVVETKLIRDMGMLRPAFDGAQDYDLMLRLIDKTNSIVHIPKILYHWREADGSTARNFELKDYVKDAGVNALSEHLNRNNMSGEVTHMDGKPGYYNINFSANELSDITIVTSRESIKEYLDGLSGEDTFKTDFVPISNQANHVKKIKTNYVMIINIDVLMDGTESIKEMLKVIKNTKTHAICPRLIKHRRIFDMGYIYYNETIQPLFNGEDVDGNTYLGDRDWVRNVSAISGKVFLCKTDDYSRALSSMSNIDKNALDYTVWSKISWQVIDSGSTYYPGDLV